MTELRTGRPATGGKTVSVQSARRTLDVLEILGSDEQGVGQIAKALGVNKSTASRLLATMASQGFVARSQATGAYRLGSRIADLHEAYMRSLRMSSDAQYALRRVATDTGETVLLTLYESEQAVYVNKVESQQPLKTSSRIGAVAPFHAGAAGKAILAFQRPEAIRRLLGTRPLSRFTPNTITSRSVLLRELTRIRRAGYSLSSEEINPGVVGIGMPLLGPDGIPFGSISVTCPKMRFNEARLTDIVAALRAAVKVWLGPSAREVEVGWSEVLPPSGGPASSRARSVPRRRSERS